MTLTERVKWVLDQRVFPSARAWAAAAGVSEKAVTTFMLRSAKDPKTGMNISTLKKLATALEAHDVSSLWFETGNGGPRGEAGATSFLADYVRSYLRKWNREGKTLDEIADRVHLSFGDVARVAGGKGSIGVETAAMWAHSLGKSNPHDLQVAAAEWWRLIGEPLHRKADPLRDKNESRARANEMVRGINGVSEEDVLSTLEIHTGDDVEIAKLKDPIRFRSPENDRDPLMTRWLTAFAEEHIRRRELSQRSEKHRRAERKDPKAPPPSQSRIDTPIVEEVEEAVAAPVKRRRRSR